MSEAPQQYREFYERQVKFLEDNDPEGLISNQYNDDAQLLSFTNKITGADALVPYFREYIKGLGYIKLISTDKYTEGDNSLFFEATVETAGGIARVYDVFVMKNGKISHHFTGLLGFTPKGS